MENKINIRLFGICREIVGSENLSIEASTSTELIDKLKSDYPDLGQIHSLVLAVNQKYVNNDVALTSTDEIALIPPVSGG